MRYSLFAVVFGLLLTVGGAFAQAPGDDVPDQIEAVLADLSEQVGEAVTLETLEGYAWERVTFNTSALGCPASAGEMAAEVITPGWRFLVEYDGLRYDYRVREDGTGALLCGEPIPVEDAPPLAVPSPAPPADASGCVLRYTVGAGETLFDIAEQCGVPIEGLVTANRALQGDAVSVSAGAVLVIPGGVDAGLVTIFPVRGAAGTIVRVMANGLPSEAEVVVGVGMPGGDHAPVLTTASGEDGALFVEALIPADAVPDSRWTVSVTTADDRRAESVVFTVD